MITHEKVFICNAQCPLGCLVREGFTPTNIWECKSGLIRQNGEIIHTDKWMEDVPERKFRTGPCEAVLQSIE
ncbi:MAG: hypothetical protein UU81_C0033G0003 [Microgenomates group bacterium GW2011_GWC1_41_8]|uniref:Uncharacterized protein n=2 Tax=Candidatus Roizmaniibacteriota TaxID=1752723 RepID=A0A0G0T3N5_9BACT|nr:MAG: hypothetical protein UT85_C0007G0028 [Candidatus Levybacteria bacterium GW2011_GWA2_40_16]KKR71663.1 MAG: hypothetical protein UU14_C0022G0011 [Candidatus Roizmanbacteria bacterium GW2011_GWB1_40_7]KKR93989.1 MAG: hypothetical protein UU41_C0015G0003 [Candidatus Roizmanbacteria bacterium GW2011_GWA1_41_13]KKS23294.1 MAG: hypothetical protein UU81_C0033G0003 [Microgenomates group bacterium GW2011_GWC1_41_8]OGK48458.1 MAG: hypothetical protein A3A55_00935 [Candidatus Roizmanbacteria bacte